MKILNLGKIFILFIFCINLYANVEIKLDKPAIYRGDIANFSIIANGSNVEFPTIKEIDGYQILGVSNSNKTIIINGDVKKTEIKSYSFRPDGDVEIPSFEVLIDGKKFNTNPVKIDVVEPKATKDGEDFVLEIGVDKKEIMLGDSVKLYLKFKYKIDAKIDDFKLDFLNVDGLSIKQISKPNIAREDDYIINVIEFSITPLVAGEFNSLKSLAYIGRYEDNGYPFDIFSNLNYKKFFSNSLNLNVKPLPDGAKIYGKFDIKSSVDKKVVNANEPVNLTLQIKGVGNLQNIEKFSLNLPNGVVYSNEPDIKTISVNNENSVEFLQIFSIVSDMNFTIPSFSFSYFDRDLNSTKTIKSDPINIEVKNQPSKSNLNQVMPPKIQKNSSNKTLDTTHQNDKNLLYLMVGILSGFLAFFVFSKIKKFRLSKEDKPIIWQISKVKNDKELFNILLPYAKSSDFIDKILQNLEENLYKNSNHKIDKKAIIRYFKSL
ncbi:protein BatD [Campylobacter sp. FMV-PI01]|uniref:Protein BatD n=1 Tax=Campylobacter portucalensis TaxID=2608384 RepID=A0A6L5WLQ6_9BACT|nr:BatD family protein [Campylobacter portucalensis]MSN96945.1 protein BatD [Campylobacter portucalensis]